MIMLLTFGLQEDQKPRYGSPVMTILGVEEHREVYKRRLNAALQLGKLAQVVRGSTGLASLHADFDCLVRSLLCNELVSSLT